MSSKAARGTKRTCQNEKCLKADKTPTKFYDLNKDPIICPICDHVYKLPKTDDEEALAKAKEAEELAAAEKAEAAKKAKLAEQGSEIDPDLAAVDDEDLADLDDAVETDADDDATDAFLPVEDDSDEDLSEIVGDNKPKVEDEG